MSEDEIAEVKARIKNENIEKADKKAERALVSFLSAQDNIADLQYWLYEPEEQDKLLCKFWYELKTTEGDTYCVSSLKHI